MVRKETKRTWPKWPPYWTWPFLLPPFLRAALLRARIVSWLYLENVTWLDYILDMTLPPSTLPPRRAAPHYNRLLAIWGERYVCDQHTGHGCDAWTTMLYWGRPMWPTYWTWSDTTIWINESRLICVRTLRHRYNVLIFLIHCWLPSNLYMNQRKYTYSSGASLGMEDQVCLSHTSDLTTRRAGTLHRALRYVLSGIV